MSIQNKTSHSTSLQAGAVGQAGSVQLNRSQNTCYHKGNRLTLFVNDGQRRVAVGSYDADHRFFTKTVKATQILRTPPGIAIQASLLRELKARGCKTVVARLVDEGRTLTTPFEAFERFGMHFNRGFGQQVVLCLERWTDMREAIVQPALWGEF